MLIYHQKILKPMKSFKTLIYICIWSQKVCKIPYVLHQIFNFQRKKLICISGHVAAPAIAHAAYAAPAVAHVAAPAIAHAAYAAPAVRVAAPAYAYAPAHVAAAPAVAHVAAPAISYAHGGCYYIQNQSILHSPSQVYFIVMDMWNHHRKQI